MQFKLLNFHKLLSNFAANIALGFSFSIIVKISGSVLYALIAYAATVLMRIAWVYAFRKFIIKYSQICTLVRIIPITLTFVSLIVINYNIIAGIILYVIFSAGNLVFKHGGNDMILIYSSGTKKTKNVGIGRIFERFGLAFAVFFGGYLLDNISQIAVFGISLGLYALSCVPLIFYYVINAHEKSFNREVVANAVCEAKENANKNKDLTKVIKNFKWQNYLIFVLYGFYDSVGTFFDIYLAANNISFTTIGSFKAISTVVQIVATIIASKLYNKIDFTWPLIISCLLFSAGIFVMPFIQYTWTFYVNSILRGLAFPFADISLFQAMLTKARILGVQSDSIFLRLNGYWTGNFLTIMFFMAFGFMAGFMFSAISAICHGIYCVADENKQSKMLVNFLCGNYYYDKKENNKKSKQKNEVNINVLIKNKEKDVTEKDVTEKNVEKTEKDEIELKEKQKTKKQKATKKVADKNKKE